VVITLLPLRQPSASEVFNGYSRKKNMVFYAGKTDNPEKMRD